MSHKDQQEVKPLFCPFCGSDAEADYGLSDRNTWGVYCLNCEANMNGFTTQEEATEYWNDRKVPSREKELLEIAERLADALEMYVSPKSFGIEASSLNQLEDWKKKNL